MGKKKLTLEFINKQFELDRYTLLTKDYKNCSQKLEYICPNGHQHSISWDNWKQGHRCPYCDSQGRPGMDVIRKFFSKYGYKLVSDVYTNDVGRLDYICLEGHRHSMRWGNFRNGRRCPSCANISRSVLGSGSNHPNWKGGVTPFNKELRNFVKAIGWTKDVFKRDDYTCQECNIRSGNLVAHHVVSLSEIRDYFNIKNIEDAQQCDMIYDIDNGRTLCESCHKLIHDNFRGGIRFMTEERVSGVVKWFSSERGQNGPS